MDSSYGMFFLSDFMNISILVPLIFLNQVLNDKHENGSWFIENSYFCLDQNTGYQRRTPRCSLPHTTPITPIPIHRNVDGLFPRCFTRCINHNISALMFTDLIVLTVLFTHGRRLLFKLDFAIFWWSGTWVGGQYQIIIKLKDWSRISFCISLINHLLGLSDPVHKTFHPCKHPRTVPATIEPFLVDVYIGTE